MKIQQSNIVMMVVVVRGVAGTTDTNLLYSKSSHLCVKSYWFDAFQLFDNALVRIFANAIKSPDPRIERS